MTTRELEPLTPTSAADVGALVAEQPRLTVVGNRTHFPFSADESPLLSTRRLNRILEIDRANMVAVVEAGVTIGELAASLEGSNLWFPPMARVHPEATIGGLLAANAAPRAIGFGPPREYVLGLRFVDGRARVISAGGRVIKYATGYNLTQTVVGSWGTLGVIVEATLRLLPLPRDRVVLGFTFPDSGAASRAALALAEHAGVLAADITATGAARTDQRPSAALTVEALASLANPIVETCVRHGGERHDRAPGTPSSGVGEAELPSAYPIEVALPRGALIPFLEAVGDDLTVNGSPATGYLAFRPALIEDASPHATRIFDLARRHGGAPIGALAWSEVGVTSLRGHLGETGIAMLRAVKRAFDPIGKFPTLAVARREDRVI